MNIENLTQIMNLIINQSKSIDPRYIKSVFYVISAALIYLINDIRMQKLFSYGINVPLFNFIKMTIGAVTVLAISRLYNPYISKTVKLPKVRSYRIYIIKCLIFVIGASLWSKGVINTETNQIPMCVVIFTSFITPLVLKIISSIFSTSEYKKNKYVIYILSCACSFIFVYIFNSPYATKVILLTTGNILYAVVDFINQLNVKQSDNNIIKNLIGDTNDTILTCLFYNFLFTSVIFGIQSIYQMLTYCSIHDEVRLILSLPMIDLLFYLLSIFSSLLATSFMLKAFALKGAAAAQIIKSFEPLIMSILTRSSVDTVIKFASLIFFIGVTYAVYLDSKLDDNCKDHSFNT